MIQDQQRGKDRACEQRADAPQFDFIGHGDEIPFS